MKDFYGDFKQNIISDDIDAYVEEILYNGVSIVESVIDSVFLERIRISIDEMYKNQEELFGKESLDKIKELDMLRSPLLYGDLFLDLAKNNLVNSVHFDEFTLRLLGYYSKTPKDDKECRLQRMKKFGL